MARKRKKNRVNATGRNPTSRFVRLDYRLLNSNAYRALSPNARSLLVELSMLFNGDNNGSLYLGVRDAAARLGVADNAAAQRAFDELQDLGLIEMTRDACFRIKSGEGSRARCWGLNWLPGPGKRLPDFSFYEREPGPGKMRARRRMERGLRALKAYRKNRDAKRLPVLDPETLVDLGNIRTRSAVRQSRTDKTRNQSVTAKELVRDPTTHIATTIGGTKSRNPKKEIPSLRRLMLVIDQLGASHPNLSSQMLQDTSCLGRRPKFGLQIEAFQRSVANDV